MAELKDKIESALNETRILVLGIQILVGFDFRGFFEPGFDKMVPYRQQIQLAALALMLAGLAVLMMPVSYHRLVLHGRNTAGLHRFATITVSAGLLPFALSMGLSFFIGAQWVLGTVSSAMLSGCVLGITLICWYGLEFWARKHKLGGAHIFALIDPLRRVAMNQEQETSLSTRVRQVFTECRVVLPGAQALLGFQLIIMWMTAFYRIPQLWKLLHLASLVSVTICTILLITPAAYHRIVEQGENSEMLHHITALLLLWAMVFLALGICGDFYVVSRMTGIATVPSTLLACGLLLLFFGLWFGYSFWKKRAVHNPELTTSHLKQHEVA